VELGRFSPVYHSSSQGVGSEGNNHKETRIEFAVPSGCVPFARAAAVSAHGRKKKRECLPAYPSLRLLVT
jgi:hypothetical protein